MSTPRPSGSAAKIRDVAEAAGVSPATVSRVLNGTSAVSAERAAAVREAATRLGYTPSGPARALRTQRAQVWAAIIADIENPFFTTMVRGIEDVARTAGHRLVLCNSDEDVDKETEYLDIVLAEQMSGVVIAAASDDEGRLEPLFERDIPVVAVDRRPVGDQDRLDSVVVDNAGGARQAIEHLARVGARRIACITGPTQATTASERLTGYRDALAEVELRWDEALVRRADFREEGGHAAALDLLDRPDRAEALFVTNNLMTLGALRAAHELGLRIPDDLLLVGFDDAPWTTLTRPTLTVVAQPTYEIGRRAAELLATASPDDEARHVVLAPELVVRQSSTRTS